MILMFSLGMELRASNFIQVVKEPRAAVIGLTAQLIGLPLAAFAIAILLNLPPLLAVGLVLLAACPGGPSSNAFTMLARGDVALSVSLTAVTSIITIITIPFVVNAAMIYWMGTETVLRLAAGPVLAQNTVTIILPIGLGMALRARHKNLADRILPFLKKAALPLLLLMISIFIVQQRDILTAGISTISKAATLLIFFTMGLALFLGWIGRLNESRRRAILMEVGIQNVAQTMAIAASPFLLNNAAFAIPGIFYAVVMNLVLLSYLALLKAQDNRSQTVSQ